MFRGILMKDYLILNPIVDEGLIIVKVGLVPNYWGVRVKGLALIKSG